MATRLSVFFHGLPDFEIFFPLAVRLRRRGRVVPVCFASSEVLRREPRLRDLIAKSGLPVTVRPNRLLKALPKHYLRRADASLCLADPLNQAGSTGRRNQAILALEHPTIFLQHGVVQIRVNYPPDGDPVPYYSGCVLTFEPLSEQSIVARADWPKVHPVGFPKNQLFAARPPQGDLPPHDRAILLCHSFRWSEQFGQGDVDRFFALVADYAARHPRDLLIVRGHRGKVRDSYKRQTIAAAALPNVLISDAYRGPLRGMSIGDVLALSDLCISTVSTAVLDSIYAGVPTATYFNDGPFFRDLPDVTDLETMDRFANVTTMADMAPILARYGQVDSNIDRACDAIEAHMAAL